MTTNKSLGRLSSRIEVSPRILEQTTSESLVSLRGQTRDYRGISREENVIVDFQRVSQDSDLIEIADIADKLEDTRVSRAFRRVYEARQGDGSSNIASLPSAPDAIHAYLADGAIDGWLYYRGADEYLHPFLVTKIEVSDPNTRRDERPSLMISGIVAGTDQTQRNGKVQSVSGVARHIDSASVSRRKPRDVLDSMGLVKEDEEIRSDYLARAERFREVRKTYFSEVFVATDAVPTQIGDWRANSDPLNGKVIHDMHQSECSDAVVSEKSLITGEIVEVPVLTSIRVFDLKRHQKYWVNTADLKLYEYDSSIKDRIVLPETHRDILDVLTTDISMFTADVVDGKSSGNVILCRGIPGVGKTLTAEIYSEIIRRPLYSIHSGSLGATAEAVRNNLEIIFKRVKHWNAVLLLDEADVFVLSRGENIVQNAIVAEFLRTLEYFSGLMFMTTNRADDIDDAILSRAAAIIRYDKPEHDELVQVWKLFLDLNRESNEKSQLSDSEIEEVTQRLPGLTPRDIKMLLRLALRVAIRDDKPLTPDTLVQVAKFRGHEVVAKKS